MLEKRRKKLGDDESAADGLIFPKLCRLVSMMLPPAVGFLAHSAVYLVGRYWVPVGTPSDRVEAANVWTSFIVAVVTKLLM